MNPIRLMQIESGERGASALELVKIARELERRVDWFVEQGPPAVVSYRESKPGLPTQAIDDALDRVAREVEFVVGEAPALVENQPGRHPSPVSVAAADELAEQARRLLKLDPDEPVHDLSNAVTAIGLLPFALRLDDGADAGTVLLRAGGVSIINGDLRVGRRRLALAHELGHYLIADPYTTDWRVASTESDALEARLDRFARALLLPEADFRQRWAGWSANADETLRDAAVRAGSHYQVDMATLARRLGELGLVDATQANSIRAVKTTQEDILGKNLVVAREMEPVFVPRVYEQAVLRLFRNETITAGRALGLLFGTLTPEALPNRPAVPAAEIWAIIS